MAFIANNGVKDMGGLVGHRSITTLPFGARYRLVDFTLSNIVNSGIKKVGIFASDKYRSLIDHVGTGQEWSLSRKSQELLILQGGGPKSAGKTYISLKDLKDNYMVFSRSFFKNVLFCASNLVCNIDFKPVMSFHQQHHADVTLICKPFERDTGQNEYNMLVRSNGSRRVTGFSDTRSTGYGYVFLDMMIMRCSVLIDLLKKGLEIRALDILDIIKINMRRLNIMVFHYGGYLRKIDSTKTYFNASMELLNPEISRHLFPRERVVYTKIKDNHPTFYGINSRTINSLVASGCRIDGDVENSMIFRQNKIAAHSTVRNSILMEGCTIGKNVELDYVILDKAVHLSSNVIFRGSPAQPVVISRNVGI